MIRKTKVWQLAALSFGLAYMTGCDTANKATAKVKSFVPPVLRHSEPEPTVLAVSESLQAHPVTPGTALNVPSRNSLPPRPSNHQFLINQADRMFADGKRAAQEGRLKEARRDFNRAIDLLMSEPLPEDPVERRRLQERLDDMADAIYHYDLESLGAGVPAEAVLAAQQPVEKQILEATLPTNPSLRDRVREQIEMTMSELPLEETDAVVSYIDYFSGERGRKILLSGFARAGRYRDMILRVLEEEGLPAELIFVAQLESHYNPTVVSYAHAVGMWQFIKATGVEYKLAINTQVDERRDPEKATRAAAKYLMDLYRRYGDWYLALAAYNCGAGCVDRAVMRTGYADFWELRRLKALPVATTNYVPVVLAMTVMYKNAEAYGIEFDPDPPFEYETVEMEAETSLNLAAAAVDRPVGQLKEMNPALLQTVAPKGYKLRLPMGSAEQLQAAFEVVPAAQRKTWRVHLVEESDTPASIAKKYGITTARLSSANNGAFPNAGSFAAIPPIVAAATAPKKASSGAKTAKATQTSNKPAAKAKTPAKPSPTAGTKSKSTTARSAGA